MQVLPNPHPYIATLSEMHTVMKVLGDYNAKAKVPLKTQTIVLNKVITQAEKDFKKLIRQLED